MPLAKTNFDEDTRLNLYRFKSLNKLAEVIYKANKENKSVLFMDLSNDEVKNFLSELYKNNVEYMLVGGLATVFHGYIRTTQDLDLWVKETPDNKKKLVDALKASDVAGAERYEDVDMIPSWSTLTIGNEGFQADLMGYMKAFKKEDFDSCYKQAKRTEFDGVPITVIHINHLIQEKEKLGRSQDKVDVENLKRIRSERSS